MLNYMKSLWNLSVLPTQNIRKPLHGAQVYYCKNGKQFNTYELLILTAGAKFFRLKNLHSTLDFYGDRITVKNLSNINKKLHLYDNMNDTVVFEKAQKLQVSQECFFNFPKFVAIEDLACRYKSAMCIIDTDLIPALNLSEKIYDREMCCTHYESLEKSDIYPGYDKLHPPQKYCFPQETLSYSGTACNTSILGICDYRIALEYVQEAYTFMSNNRDAAKSDIMYVEQVLFPLIAIRHNKSVFPFIDRCYSPATGSFELENTDGTWKRGWAYDNIDVISDSEFPIYHIWIAKKQLMKNDLYRRFAIMRIAEYIYQYFPKCYKAMIDLPEMAEAKKLIEKYKCTRQAVEEGKATDILWPAE